MSKSTIATTVLVAGGLLGLAPSFSIADEQGGLRIADNDSIYIDGKSFQVMPGKAKGDVAAQIKTLSARDLGPGVLIFRSGNRLYLVDAQAQMINAQMQATATPASYAYDPRTYNPALTGGGSVGYNHRVATDYLYDPRAYNPHLIGGGSSGYNQHLATDYAYDPRAYNPRLLGGGSTGYNYNVATDYAYDPRAYNPRLLGGGSTGYNYNVATDYAYDPKGYYRPDLIDEGGAGYNPRGYNSNINPNPNPWAHDYAYDPRPMASPVIIYDPDYVEYRLKKAFADNWTPSATAMGNSH